uniref:Integrin subunit alpha X n=1 Tax=Calidris pygmaea TaxID=425635 RepID=A0A8C3J042_9CHAR
FHGDARGAFGQTVAQFGTIDDGGVLVGAPLQRGAVNQMGTIYRCRYHSGTCQEVPITRPPGAVNTSMGLALASRDTRALACGPTAPQTCGKNVHLNGFCVLLDTNLQQLRHIPDAPRECPKRSSDLVLLIDGSGSIKRQDFSKMKIFIAEVMKRFKGTDTQVPPPSHLRRVPPPHRPSPGLSPHHCPSPSLLGQEGPVLGAVGAYDWSGGVFVYDGSKETTFVNVSRASGDMNDAYLGYAAESLSLWGHRALALGAPRYRHVGRLLLFHLRNPWGAWELLAEATGTQVGSYFGASLCALDADGDGSAEVLLVGAPMFYGGGSGGRVAVCPLPPRVSPQEGRLRCQQTLQGQPGHPLGRFGASLGHLGDVDGDGWPDVAVGAPLEDEEQGAVYVFRGKKGGVASQYSQRIPGARFSSGPRYFGQAISGGQDLTGDRLPDVAVGAQGQVLLLRSQPLLKVRLKVDFQPQQIPTAAFDCQEEEALKGEVARATICFLSSKKTPDNFGSQLSTTLRYQAALDPGRAMVRAVFPTAASWGTRWSLCTGQGCPRDTLTPLVLRLTYEATGDPIQVAGGLRPALSEDSEMGALPFEKDCGDDNICIDDLQMSFTFSGLDTIVVGVTDTVDITINLRNHGENSYGATVQLQHAAALSYRKAVVLQVPPEPRRPPRGPQGPPGVVLKSSGRVLYDGGRYQNSAGGAELQVRPDPWVPGGWGAVGLGGSRLEGSGAGGSWTPVSLGVGGAVGLGGSGGWGEMSLGGGLGPPVSLGVGGWWVRGGLGVGRRWVRGVWGGPWGLGGSGSDGFGGVLDPWVPGEWVVRGRCPGPWWGSGGLGGVPGPCVPPPFRLPNPPPQVQTEVERLEPPNPLPFILGGSVGGLLLLALLALGLYKMGFFKRRYKEMMEGNETPTTPLGDPQG